MIKNSVYRVDKSQVWEVFLSKEV